MKLVGIDYGSKRVGIAVSDAAGTMAFPKMVLPNNTSLLPELVSFITKEEASEVVVGESKKLSGEDNPIMNDIRHFVRELERACGLPVRFEPEFYTSREAKRLLEEAEAPNGPVDAHAAAIILNSFIARSSA